VEDAVCLRSGLSVREFGKVEFLLEFLTGWNSDIRKEILQDMDAGIPLGNSVCRNSRAVGIQPNTKLQLHCIL